jgi:hypothetical protein
VNKSDLQAWQRLGSDEKKLWNVVEKRKLGEKINVLVRLKKFSL